MRVIGILLLSGFLCPASRVYADIVCSAPSTGDLVVCNEGDRCMSNASGPVEFLMRTDSGVYACRRPDGTLYRPSIKFRSQAVTRKKDAGGQAVPNKTNVGITPFRSFRSPVSGAKTAPAQISAPRAFRNQNVKAQVRPAAGSAESFRAAGDAYYAKEQLNNAITNWEKAKAMAPGLGAELNPKLAMAYCRRGAVLYLRGDHDGAIRDSDEAYKLDPKNPYVIKTRAIAHKARSGSIKTDDSAAAPAAQDRPEPDPALPAPPAAEETSAPAAERSGPVFGPLWAVWSLILWVLWSVTFLLGALHTKDNIERASGSSLSVKKWKAFKGFVVSLAAAGLVVAVLVLLFRALGVPMAVVAAGFTYKLILPAACAAVLLAAIYAFARIGAGSSVPLHSVAADIRPSADIRDKKASQPGTKVDPAILSRAKELFSENQYEEALKALSKKPFDELDPGDLNLFLDLYIKVGDFYRAKLTLNRLMEEFHDYPELAGEYAYYLSLASACKEKGEAALTFQLRQTGVEFMLKALSVSEAPREIYSLAEQFEKEGETGLALRLYQAFVRVGYQYQDAEQRYKDLKAKPPPPPAVPARKAASAGQAGRGSHLFGQVLEGRYQIRGNLGEGAMGVVYEGWDLKAAKKVAVKQMHSWLKTYPEEYRRFKHEAEIVGRLKHPNIVGVNAITEQAGEIFLVFDFVEGRPLSDILNERKRLPLADCLTILKGVCEAVHYAHKQNVIHRDLKLANIMVDAKGQAMVVDFGLASELRESLTRVSHQTMSGTPAYMAPEQYAGVVKRESDVYAIGVCLYELLTGELPFQGNDPLKQKKEKDYREVSSMLPWLPGGVDGLLARALEPEPSQRIADALDFFEALKKL